MLTVPANKSARGRSPVKRTELNPRRSHEKRSSRRSRSRSHERSFLRSWSPARSSRRIGSTVHRSSRRIESPVQRSSHWRRSPEKRRSPRRQISEKRSSRWSRSPFSGRSRTSERRPSRRGRSREKSYSRQSWSRRHDKRSSRRSRSHENKSSHRNLEKGSAGPSNEDYHTGLPSRKRRFEVCQGGLSPSKKDGYYCVPEHSATRSDCRGRCMPWSEMDQQHYRGVKIPEEKDCCGCWMPWSKMDEVQYRGVKNPEENDCRGRWMPWSEMDEAQYRGVKIPEEKGKGKGKVSSWAFLDMSEEKGQGDLDISSGEAEASDCRGRWMPWSEMDEEHYRGVKNPEEKGKVSSSASLDVSDEEGQGAREISRGKVETSDCRGRWMPWSEMDEEEFRGVKNPEENGIGKVISRAFLDVSEENGQGDLEISRGMAEASDCRGRWMPWSEMDEDHYRAVKNAEEKGKSSWAFLDVSDEKGQDDLEISRGKAEASGCRGRWMPWSEMDEEQYGGVKNPEEKGKVCTFAVLDASSEKGQDDLEIYRAKAEALGKDDLSNSSEDSFQEGKEDVPVRCRNGKPAGKQVVLIQSEKSVHKEVQIKIPPICPRHRLNGPALAVAWEGSFDVLDYPEDCRLCEGFQARASLNLSSQAENTVKNMEEVLQFKMHPRHAFWPKIFKNQKPDKDDIALYFHPRKTDSSRKKFSSLLELMGTHDLMLRTCLEHVELLVYSSRQLTEDCQILSNDGFLWGVFRSLKGKKNKGSKQKVAKNK